jgi:RNA polymerase primary sigma factor
VTIERIGEVDGPHHKELDLMRVYLDELGWHPLLGRDDEVRLAKMIEAGVAAQDELAASRPTRRARRAQLQAAIAAGERARDEFTKSNLRLVVSVAKRYQHRGVDLADLIQEGNIGLIKAIERFDWRRGYKFSTYATWWIRKSVMQAVSDGASVLRLPRHRREQARMLADVSDRLERRLGHAPGSSELAGESGMRTADVVAISRAVSRVVSLSAPIDEDGNELGELVPDDTVDVGGEATETLLPREVEHLLGGLSASASRVIRLRYGIGGGGPRTAAQVGAILSISPERVRQIEMRALANLRHKLPRYYWAS